MTTDPTPRRCDGCGRGLAVYTVPPGQAPRGVTYVCLDCADRSKPSVSVAPPPTVLTPDLRRWDWTGAKVPPSAEEQAAAVRAMMAIPFDELGYLRARLAETTEIARRLEAERDELRGRVPVVVDMDATELRAEINMLINKAMPEGVEALIAERDALSADFDTKIAHFSDELNHARARVAEMEEAARWRHYPDVEPPDGSQIEAVIAGDRVIGRWRATLAEVSSYGRGWSGCPFDWRPLGPGPEVSGG